MTAQVRSIQIVGTDLAPVRRGFFILSPPQRLAGRGQGEGEFYLFLICLYPFESKVLELLKFLYLKIHQGDAP